MSNFINTLLLNNLGLSKEFLWGSIIIIIPLLLIVFFFSFSLNFIREYLLSRKVKKFMSGKEVHFSEKEQKKWHRMNSNF